MVFKLPLRVFVVNLVGHIMGFFVSLGIKPVFALGLCVKFGLLLDGGDMLDRFVWRWVSFEIEGSESDILGHALVDVESTDVTLIIIFVVYDHCVILNLPLLSAFTLLCLFSLLIHFHYF